MTDQPPPLKIPAIYLTGPMPHGNVWCACCVMLYIGEISSEVEYQQYVRELHQEATAAGADFITVELPERDNMQLQPAMTVAYSTYFPQTPMPVCWSHIQGVRPRTADEKQEDAANQSRYQNPIIEGKAFGSEQYRG